MPQTQCEKYQLRNAKLLLGSGDNLGTVHSYRGSHCSTMGKDRFARAGSGRERTKRDRAVGIIEFNESNQCVSWPNEILEN